MKIYFGCQNNENNDNYPTTVGAIIAQQQCYRVFGLADDRGRDMASDYVIGTTPEVPTVYVLCTVRVILGACSKVERRLNYSNNINTSI